LPPTPNVTVGDGAADDLCCEVEVVAELEARFEVEAGVAGDNPRCEEGDDRKTGVGAELTCGRFKPVIVIVDVGCVSITFFGEGVLSLSKFSVLEGLTIATGCFACSCSLCSAIPLFAAGFASLSKLPVSFVGSLRVKMGPSSSLDDTITLGSTVINSASSVR